MGLENKAGLPKGRKVLKWGAEGEEEIEELQSLTPVKLPPPPYPAGSHYISPGEILYSRFRIISLIGKGGFAAVYQAYDIVQKKKVAVKVLKKDAPKTHPPFAFLHLECRVLNIIQRSEGFPKTHFFGSTRPESDDVKMLVLDLLGPSLHHLFALCGHRFSYRTMLLLLDQLLERISTLHRKGIIHRDIKPDNIVIGRGPTKKMIYLIDFGLSHVMKSPDEIVDQHAKETRYIGTPRYMSKRAHLGYRQTKRDDLESLVYLTAFLLNKGHLPWTRIDFNGDDIHDRLYSLKMSTSLRQLFKAAPQEFQVFAEMIMKLGVNEEPRYDDYRKLFRTLGEILNVKYDEKEFDWAGFEGSLILKEMISEDQGIYTL